MAYDDERLDEIKAEKKQALRENEQLFGGMISESGKYYQDQIDASKEWADKQTQLQQEQTDFAIEKIEQQKDQAKKDYTKEQSGAYVDWQKQSNEYGVNAEQTASMGMTNTGYSESSQVQMYTAYQNRVATARESYNRAVLNYDNAITEARLQNNSILAEIAYNALKQQLELSLQGFQYKNDLLINQANMKLQIQAMYNQEYKNVLDKINTEKSMAEQVRQFNAQLAEEKRQYNSNLALQREQFAWQKAKASASGGGSGSSGGSGGSGGGRAEKDGKRDITKALVSTEYYQGDLNSDVSKYGAFGNGYQPKGISGHGKLSKTGDMIDVATNVKYGTHSGQDRTVTQNVWKAEDGTLWYWQGLQNKYIQIK